MPVGTGSSVPLRHAALVAGAHGWRAFAAFVARRGFLAATVAAMAPTSVLYAAIGDSIVAEKAGRFRAPVAALYVAMTVVSGALLWRAWRGDRPKVST